MSGYIRLHRQLLDSPKFRNPNHLKIWVWMLLKANYKSTIITLQTSSGFTDIPLERGQFVFGRNKAEDELKINSSMIYRVLKSFESEKSIVVKSNNKYSIVTICNYDSYNSNFDDDEQPVNSQRTASEQPVNTDKKDKKVKKVKKDSINLLILSVEEEAFLKLVNKITGRKGKILDEKTRRQFQALRDLNYTGKDFKKAIENAKSEMKVRGRQGYLTPEFITRPIEFLKYVDMNLEKEVDLSTVYVPAKKSTNDQMNDPAYEKNQQ